jgi:VanZ family protein
MKNRLLRASLWLTSLLILIVIMGLSLIPQSPAPGAWDKLAHATAYSILVLNVLFAAAWAPRLGEGRWPTSHVVIVAVAVSLGAAIEILQDAFFGRTADVLDVTANALGAVMGTAAWYGVRHVSTRVTLTR